MGTLRATLIGGAANFTHSGYSSALADNGRFDITQENSAINSGMFGLIDEVNVDTQIKISGTPLTFSLSSNPTTPAALYPYLTPSFGAILPASTDTPFIFAAPNGDVYTAVNAVLTKMPDLSLGVDGPNLGAAEWTGIIADGLEPDGTNPYYTVQSGQTFTPLAIDRTKIPRGKYSLTWAFTASSSPIIFSPKDKITISFETTLEPNKVQGRTRAFRLTKLAVMTKLEPVGLTAAQIDASLKFQGTGATHGHTMSGVATDLTITGPINILQKKAAIKSAGFRFGNSELRVGELGFYSTVDPTSGTIGAILSFS